MSQCNAFVGDGPGYSCTLCGRTFEEHRPSKTEVSRFYFDGYESSFVRAEDYERLMTAARQVETVMMIVQPRSHTREYLEALEALREALP